MSWLPVDFGAPWYLLLLLALPAVYMISRRSLAGLSLPRRISAISIRTFVLLILVLALSEIRLLRTNDRLAVIFVLDRSESIPPEKRDAARRYILEESLRGRNTVKEDMVGIVTFGKRAGIEWIPKAEDVDLESFATLIEPEGTDISAAIRLSVAAFPNGVGRRIVLLTDGNENQGDVLEEVRKARAQGVTVDVVPLTYAYPHELVVDKVVVAPQVNNSQPFDVRVVVQSSHATKARLRLFENDRLIQQQDDIVELRPGKNVLDFRGLRIDQSGLYFYEARLEPMNREDDNLLQNNTAFGFTVVEGEPRILVCTGQPDEDRHLVAALRAENTQVEVLAPEFLPTRAEAYLDFDAIFLSNVAASQLSEETMELFEGLVKTVGIGFVMVGGDESFGAGGYQGSPIERLLPVEMDIKQRKVMPNGALCIVVHSCELGNGNWWARQVIRRAVSILSPRDYAGVVSYDMGQDRWLFPMWPVSKRQQMLGRLNSFNPGDMLSFQGIMTLALNGLQKTPASIKHMIVLSDGDPTMPSATLVSQIRQARITISTICYGSHGVNPVEMQNLAQVGGGKFHFLQSPQNLPEIFIREVVTVSKSLISEEPFQPQVAASSPILQGLQIEALPQLDGFVLTTPKSLATVSVVHPPRADDPTVDPVLATWSYGLGKAVAFTSDAGTRWGKNWASWGGFQRFWLQCARWVMRARSESRFRLTRSIRGNVGLVTIDAVTPDGRFINGLDFEATVLTPDFEARPTEARQIAPGRYSVSVPVDKKGSYTVSLRYKRPDGTDESLVTGLSVPYSPEYKKLETDQETLERIAAAGGGRFFPDPRDTSFFTRDFPVTRDVRDVWWNLLLIVIVFFFIDVFIRRVVVNYAEAILNGLRGVAAMLGARAAAPAPTDERLAALLQRKAEIRESTKSRYKPGASRMEQAGSESAGKMEERRARWDATASEEKKPAQKSAAAKREDDSEKERPKVAEKRSEGSTYTSRLLEAKKRALKRDGDEKGK